MRINLRHIFRRDVPETDPTGEPTPPKKQSEYTNSKAMRLSTVYRCVDCISSAVAQLPLEIYRVDKDGYKYRDRSHPVYDIIAKAPNNRMTRHTLMCLWVQDLHLRGNAYSYIKRDEKSGNPSELIYLPPGYVTVNAPKSLFEEVTYSVTGIRGKVSRKDMIHIVNRSLDGVTGVSTISYAAQTLGLSYDAEEHARNFFGNGCGIGGILKSSTLLQGEQAKKIKKAWDKAVASNGMNGVVVLGADLDFRPMTVNPSDAQLLETRQFNVVDICRFFGVSPVKAFDLSKSSYSTVEATNISFLTDTLSPLLEKIELELETKLFGKGENIDVRFDVSQLLRADKQSLASYFSTLFQIGAIKPDEIRRELDLPPVKGGDRNYIQVNLTPLDSITAQGTEPTNETIEN